MFKNWKNPGQQKRNFSPFLEKGKQQKTRLSPHPFANQKEGRNVYQKNFEKPKRLPNQQVINFQHPLNRQHGISADPNKFQKFATLKKNEFYQNNLSNMRNFGNKNSTKFVNEKDKFQKIRTIRDVSMNPKTPEIYRKKTEMPTNDPIDLERAKFANIQNKFKTNENYRMFNRPLKTPNEKDIFSKKEEYKFSNLSKAIDQNMVDNFNKNKINQTEVNKFQHFNKKIKTKEQEENEDEHEEEDEDYEEDNRREYKKKDKSFSERVDLDSFVLSEEENLEESIVDESEFSSQEKKISYEEDYSEEEDLIKEIKNISSSKKNETISLEESIKSIRKESLDEDAMKRQQEKIKNLLSLYKKNVLKRKNENDPHLSKILESLNHLESEEILCLTMCPETEIEERIKFNERENLENIFPKVS